MYSIYVDLQDLRSCLFCCADCDCWWLVTGVIWGVLGVGALVVCRGNLGCSGCGCTGC